MMCMGLCCDNVWGSLYCIAAAPKNVKEGMYVIHHSHTKKIYQHYSPQETNCINLVNYNIYNITKYAKQGNKS